MTYDKALIERAVLALERIAGALAAEPLPVSEAAVLDTLSKGASLRSCARLHGTTVGIVRGIRARKALEGSADDK
jgi:uncharacterized protein (DUF697 family)